MERRICLRGPGEMLGFLHQLVQRHRFLTEATDESAQGHQAPGELLNIAEDLRQLHFFNGTDLLRICLNASAGHQEAEQFSSWDAEGTLGRIQFDSEPSQIGECFSRSEERRVGKEC